MGRIYARTGSAATIEREAPASIEMHERQRPHVMRHSPHTSREAEIQREDLHPELLATSILNPQRLAAPTPQPGYVQRWIADGTTAGQGSSGDWTVRIRQGWAPRSPDTISERQRAIWPSAKTQSGIDVIRIGGLVLCEIPRQVMEQRRQAVEDVIGRQRRAVPKALNEFRKREGVREAIGELELTDDDNSFTGRRAATMT